MEGDAGCVCECGCEDLRERESGRVILGRNED